MFGIYGGARYHMRRLGGGDSPPTIGHDRVNYMNPRVNYDKPPRKIRPKSRPKTPEEPSNNSDGNPCTCAETLNLTLEELQNLRSNPHDEADCAIMQSQKQMESTFVQGTEVLTKMFTCLAVGQTNHKHGGRYSYSALDNDAGERMELERKTGKCTSRDTASLAARTFFRSKTRYSVVEHLNDIGSRIDKNWFRIKDNSVKTERLMTLQPYTENCVVPVHTESRNALLELFQALRHPYIYPVLDVDFTNVASRNYVVTVLPLNPKGTLKDFIYKSHWQDDWTQKYQQRATGIPLKQVQRLGRQILEGLLFLQDRGFPPWGHLHSGNIILQNGVARLSGVENTLFGLTSRIYPIIKKRLRENRDAIDSVCFGHVLFEMCAGYELSSAHPSSKHLEDISSYPQVVTVLEFIFGFGEQYPSIEEILCCEFFRNLDLREMRAMPLPESFQMPFSPTVRHILKEVRKIQKQKSRRGRRTTHPSQGTTTDDGSTPTSSEASTSTAGCGGMEDNGIGSSYNTPSASLAHLASPSSDYSSPEHPSHRHLDASSPQRLGASSPQGQEVFHTPPHTPPTTNHIFQSPSRNHNDRPLTTTRYPVNCNDSWLNGNHVTQNGPAVATKANQNCT